MRDKNFDADLLKTLNDQPMPAAPLTDDEFARILDAACAKLPKAKPAKHRVPWGRMAPVWPWGWAASTLPPPPWPSSCP